MARELVHRAPRFHLPRDLADAAEMLGEIRACLPPTPRPVQSLAKTITEHKRPIQLALGVAAVGLGAVACYRWFRARERAEEPDPFAPPTSLIEVSAEVAQGVPVSFSCPAALRSTVLERCMLLERTPTLCQKIKSIAGRWCDEQSVPPDKRPAYIAGAIASCMCVPEMEQHLLMFERGHNIQELYKRVRQHQQAITPEQRKLRLLDWLTRPGRR